jgi:opacity protein-like surface antigen
MRKRFRPVAYLGTLVIGWLAAGASMADHPNVWDGPYVGAESGGTTNSGCDRWIVSAAAMNASERTISQACGGGSFVEGLQFGENFQYEHIFWGLAADINLSTRKTATGSWLSNGSSPPAGAYATSERLSPDGFLILAPRLGYAGREWAPYLRAGGLVAFGGRDSSISYKPPGATGPTASFNGGIDTFGWVAGGGVEWGLYGPWSIGLEYLHASLDTGRSGTASCSGTVAACQAFSGIAFENLHNAYSSNLFRIAVTYYIDYW